jgi:hypothetical protein
MNSMKRETVIFEIRKTINMIPGGPATPFKFRNHYRCPNDQTKWKDEWSCACDDRCPTCNAEIEPYFSERINA